MYMHNMSIFANIVSLAEGTIARVCGGLQGSSIGELYNILTPLVSHPLVMAMINDDND